MILLTLRPPLYPLNPFNFTISPRLAQNLSYSLDPFSVYNRMQYNTINHLNYKVEIFGITHFAGYYKQSSNTSRNIKCVTDYHKYSQI